MPLSSLGPTSSQPWVSVLSLADGLVMATAGRGRGGKKSLTRQGLAPVHPPALTDTLLADPDLFHLRLRGFLEPPQEDGTIILLQSTGRAQEPAFQEAPRWADGGALWEQLTD
jgi:hypothetical protein